MFSYFMQLSTSTPLPKAMRNSKRGCWQTFLKRMRQVGSPIENFAKDNVNAKTGEINWAKGGCYEIVWDEDDHVSQVKYRDVSVDVELTITREYELECPWDIAAAAICRKPSKILMAEFFPAGKGPHAVMDKKGKALEQLCQEVLAEIAEKESYLKTEQAATKEEQFVGSAMKEKRKQRLKQAQEEAKASDKRRRRVVLTT